MSTRSFIRICFTLYGLIGLTFYLAAISQLQADAAPSSTRKNVDPPFPFETSQILHIPGTPGKGWCYDVGWTANGKYYLSDNSQAQVDVIQIHASKKDTLLHPLGHSDFMGPMGCAKGDYSQEGPEGVEVIGNQVWASDGNSHVLVFDAHTGQLLHRIDTKGKFRADEMSINPNLGLVVITNPDETFRKPHPGIPYLSFISTRSYQIVATLPFPYAQPGQSGLQAPLWIGGNELLVDVPAPQGNNGGELDRVAINEDGYGNYQAQVLQRYALTDCSPSGLALDTQTGIAAVGCAGTKQIIWNMRTNQTVAFLAIPGVDIVAASNHHFFFPSYLKQTLTITDERGHIEQVIKTSAQSHTVTADPATGQIFVPLDGGNIMILQPRHPSGTVTLNWNSNKNVLTITLHVTGLPPSNTVPVHSYKGTCQSRGTMFFPLNPIPTNANGEGTSTTNIRGTYGIPRGAWSINVDSAGTPPLTTCIAIHNRSRSGHSLLYQF